MTKQYHIHDICNYERITRRYCKIDYLDEESPNTMALIDLAYKEKEFNAGYVQFIIDKHLQLLVDYVYEKKGINVSNIPILRQEIYNNNICEEAYEKWLDDCAADYFCANPEEMVDKIIEQDYTQMLYFYY